MIYSRWIIKILMVAHFLSLEFAVVVASVYCVLSMVVANRNKINIHTDTIAYKSLAMKRKNEKTK